MEAPNFLIAMIALTSYAGWLSASESEVWNCTESTYTKEILVIAELSKSVKGNGSVTVAGVNHDADYGVRGFDRRWNFGINEMGRYKYAFIIDPKGAGTYFDFTGTKPGEKVMPSQFYHCKKASE